MPIVFFAYHLMIGIGMMFLGSTLLASWFRWRGTLFEKRWLLWFFVLAVIPAFVANEAGWVTAEVGRQPWVVYPTLVDGAVTGGLKTADGLSEVVRAGQVLGSIVMFALIYALLFVLWLVVLNSKIQHGPDEPTPDEPESEPGPGLLEAASGRVDHSGTLTEAKQRPGPKGGDSG